MSAAATRSAAPQSTEQTGATIRSYVTLAAADGSDREVIFSPPKRFEAPNWSPDGQYLLLNSEGKLWRVPVEGGEPEQILTGEVTGINNDHGISPDGSLFAISAGHIYTLASTGGAPRRLTEHTPSYYHGWSPDGKTLVYCAQREGVFNLYSIGVEGGAEKRLTFGGGYDDGPDYSPDGQWIYFNSDRSGSWCIWRIPAEGDGVGDADAERITNDDYEDWFPHPSPDGKWLLFLSYPHGTKGHPPNLNVVLRRIPLPGRTVGSVAPEEIVELFGGQGTINVSSWSPDSRRFAYVSYS